ncbi:MAG: phage Gp37/Gp68 family protein [Candidatus Aminicenantes bacterium]|nr:phage Gp37/Gp68 family protein [Candidatus Aminicenantes bacterium]
MKSKSNIEWTDSTWNPVTGCTKISIGCQNCYAERMAYRLKAMKVPAYKNGFDLTIHPENLQAPLKTKKSKMIFVNSMSDLFHKDVPVSFIYQMIDVMREAYWHTFQILTKRSSRLKDLSKDVSWPDNVWVGVTVESNELVHRIDDLKCTNAKTRFLSMEPLLTPMNNLDLSGIDWVIVGGESGPGSRPMEERWVLDIKNQCEKFNAPFFFKQWGGVNKKKAGRLLLNKTWDGIPDTFINAAAV